MPKILIINACWQCEDSDAGTDWHCERENREIPDSEKIPEWCPLPDAEVKDE